MTPQSNRKKGIFDALSLIGHLGFHIAIPLVVFALIGRWLDKAINASPWFLITGIVLSLIVSSVTIGKRIRRILDDIDSESKK